MNDLSPELLLGAYAQGLFPMAMSRDDPRIYWLNPDERGLFELDKFHISRRLAAKIRQENFTIRTNSAFEAVIDACARPDTWINAPIRRAYADLHRLNHAHSLEVWMEGQLAGGVYGVSLGGAFFGESMFSHRRDASKIALAFLSAHLRRAGFRLFDTQYLTPHLASLGAIAVPRAAYLARLQPAIRARADFGPPQVLTAAALGLPGQPGMQPRTQMS